MELRGDREFRYRVPLWRIVGYASIVVLSVLSIVTWGALRFVPDSVWAAAPPSVRPADWTLAWWNLPLTLMFMAAALTWFVQSVALNRRGSVQITKAGIVTSAGREEQQRAFWQDVRELRIKARLGLVASTRPKAELTAEPGSVRIEDVTEDFAELVVEITRRAGLTLRERRWWGEVWSRPPESEADA